MGDGGASIPPWSVLQGAFGPASPRSKQGLGLRMTHVFAPRHGCQYGQAPCCMACMSRSTLFQCHWKPDRASNMIHPKLLKRTSARKKKNKQPAAMLAQIKGKGTGRSHGNGTSFGLSAEWDIRNRLSIKPTPRRR